MSEAGLNLYDLALADEDVRPSPFCWIAKFALLHKGLDFETSPVRFADKSAYPDPEHGKIPILVRGDEVVTDSAHILAWLEKHYPDTPFVATEGERAAAAFFQSWALSNVMVAIAPALMLRIWSHVHEDDKDYYRKTREERFGKTLEEVAATPGVKDRMEAALKTLSAPLARHRFLGGSDPNLSDYYVMAQFMWQRSVTLEALYETPQPVAAWQERMLDLFDGYARKAKTAG